jgi:hypothetical protein
MTIPRTPQGITPPSPGLEHEEPVFVPEKDIPDEGAAKARNDGARDEPPLHKPERE